MRDHRSEPTRAEREAEVRDSIDITERMGQFAPRMKPSKARAAKRAKRKRTARSKRTNR